MKALDLWAFYCKLFLPFIIGEKGIVSLIGAWISNKFGILLQELGLLVFLMVVDYISGMLAAKKEAYENPNDRKYGWSSKKSILGIYRKLGYMLTIVVAISMDYIIFCFARDMGIECATNTMFGLLICIWFDINQLISILENVGRLGAELPQFLKKSLAELENNLEHDYK